MTPNRKLWLSLGGIFTAVVITAGTVGLWVGLFFSSSQQGETQRQTYQRPVSRVEIDSRGGDVALTVGESDQVAVERKLHWDDTWPRAIEQWDGDVLRITTTPCAKGESCSIDFTVRVPNSINAQIRTSGGDISTLDIRGDQRLDSDGGDVGVRNAGSVRVRTEGGDFGGSSLRGTNVDVATEGGDVSVRCVRAPEEIRVATGGGDVEVVVPVSGSYQVDADADGGSQEVAIDDDSTADRRITVDSAGGDMHIRYAD